MWGILLRWRIQRRNKYKITGNVVGKMSHILPTTYEFINMEEVAEDAYKNTELLLSQYTKVMFRIEKNLVDIDYGYDGD